MPKKVATKAIDRKESKAVAVSTFKFGVGPGHDRGVHGPVGLNSIGLVGILVGGGPLKGHILVLIPGAMLRHMRLNLVGWVLVLHPQESAQSHAMSTSPSSFLLFSSLLLLLSLKS